MSIVGPEGRKEEVSRSRPHQKHAKNQKYYPFSAAPAPRWRVQFGRHKIARKVNWAGLTEIKKLGRPGIPVFARSALACKLFVRSSCRGPAIESRLMSAR
jgi:hypothetical protein